MPLGEFKHKSFHQKKLTSLPDHHLNAGKKQGNQGDETNFMF